MACIAARRQRASAGPLVALPRDAGEASGHAPAPSRFGRRSPRRTADAVGGRGPGLVAPGGIVALADGGMPVARGPADQARDAEAAAPRLPPAALAGMEDWQREVAWALVAGRRTYRLRGPGGEVRYLKVAPLQQAPTLSEERERLAWAAGRLPVPAVLDSGGDGELEWLLTAGLPGVDATAERWRADPPRLVPLLAEGLRRLHALPAADCPFDHRLEGMLRAARARVAACLVDPERDFHREHGVLDAGAALARLDELRPAEEDFVVCHGDYCLPNVLLDGGRVRGYLDLGGLGVADRWWDLAVATWSVTWNLGPGWEDRFLDAYGVRRDARKQAFYRLLYDLLP